MSNNPPSEHPAWLIDALQTARKYGATQDEIDLMLAPLCHQPEERPTQDERIREKKGTRSVNTNRRSKKVKVRTAKGKEVVADENRVATPTNQLDTPSNHVTNSFADLAVNTQSSNSVSKQKSLPTSREFDSPSSSNSPASLTIPETPLFAQGVSTSPASYGPPVWYLKLNNSGPAYKMWAANKRDRQAEQSLQVMKNCIDRCEKEKNPKILSKIFIELWHEIHKAEVKLKGIDARLLRKNVMLGPGDQGILRILNSKSVDYPSDLCADALQLYNRWCIQVFTVDLLRGIVKKRVGNRSADSISGEWTHSADYYGEGDLVMGQWWPTQLCTVRDSAHGAAQGGIYGQAGKGAYSIVLAGGNGYGYDDEDNGDELWYSGTVSKDPAKIMARNQNREIPQVGSDLATDNTRRLIESCDIVKNPVRVIRSHNLPKKNAYRPAVGFRYDGLYDVVRYQFVNQETGAYRFHLRRCPGQNPIRCQENAARRPTDFEIEEYNKLKLDG